MAIQDDNEFKEYLDETEFTDLDFRLLAGFYKFHSLQDTECPVDWRRFPKIVTVTYSSEFVNEVTIDIRLRERKIIIREFITTDLKPSVALLTLESIVETARDYDFKYIYLTAIKLIGDFDSDKIYNGFYSWGKYGFLMNNLYEHLNFLFMMKAKGIMPTILYDLIKETGGKEFWLKEGDTWNGYFDTHPNSVSSLILSHAVKSLQAM